MHYDECCRVDDLRPIAGRVTSDAEPAVWTLSVRRILFLGAASWLVPIGIALLFV